MVHLNIIMYRPTKYSVICVGCVVVTAVLWQMSQLMHYGFAPASNSQSILVDVSRQQRLAKYKQYLHEVENSPRNKRLPDVIGLGVEKCGTGAWITFLNHHPLIATNPSGQREKHYFDRPYLPPLQAYISQLPNASRQQLVVEKTPAYFNLPPFSAPQRIKEVLPDVKFVLIVCDPVYRYFSDIAHELVMGTIKGENESSFLKSSHSLFAAARFGPGLTDSSIKQIINSRYRSHILLAGIYDIPLKRWLQLFRREQIFIINGEEFITNPGRQIELLQDFLNIPKLLLEEDFVKNSKTGFFCPQAPWMEKPACIMGTAKGRTRNRNITHKPDDIKQLAEFFKPFNENLFSMLGTRYNWTNT